MQLKIKATNRSLKLIEMIQLAFPCFEDMFALCRRLVGS